MNSQIIVIIYTFAILAILFGAGWYYCFHKKIFSWLDFFWSGSFIIAVATYHTHGLLVTGEIKLRLIDFLYIFWSLRLSTHLYLRIAKNGEDKRYLELKRKWKVWYGLNFFFLFQAEVFLTIVLSIPIVLHYPNSLVWQNYLSLFIFCVAVTGETIADKQLADFIKSNNDRSKVCNVGLWKYSRHPNYFCEWLIWISFTVCAMTSTQWWYGLIPAVVMYLMLTKVTGIPPAETSSLASKRENYLQYQKVTNAFFPWFPRKIIFCLIFVLGSLSSMASGVPVKQCNKIKYVFDNLRADNIHILDDFYAKDAVFIDPIGAHNGIKSVKDYYQNLYKNVRSIKFTYKDLVSNKNTHALYWTMTLSADGLNGGSPMSLEGNSHIKFNDAGLVSYHRDYFDMGEFIYEHIPVMGWTIKKVKEKLRGKN
jgi:steroid 5-alpha reductase family enzyme